jgi:hypothetical protein
MSRRRASGPHNPDGLLNQVGKRLQAASSPAGWELRAMTVCTDGSLRLYLVPVAGPPEAGVELLWERESTTGFRVDGFGGSVTCRPSKNSSSAATQTSLARLAAKIFAALPPAEFDLLRFAEGSGRTITFNKQISSLLFGGWLAEGKTNWRGYLCCGMSQSFEPPTLTVEFADGDNSLTVSLMPRLEKSSAHSRPTATGFDLVVRDGAGASVVAQPGTPGAFVGFLASRRLEPHCRIIEDPELVVPESDETASGKPAPWEWGRRRGWRRFFHMDEVMELAEVRRTLHGPHAEVVLGERECHNAHPCSYGPRMEVYDFPAHAPWPDLYSGKLLASMVSEKDLISGAGPLFQQMLDAAAAVPGCRAVVVADSCVSSLLAEDAGQRSESVAGEVRTGAMESGDNMFLRAEHFYSGLLAGGQGAGHSRSERATVNLVGYMPGRGRSELVELLARCGVRVNSFFLPDIHLTHLDTFASAICNVLFPISHRSSAYRAIERASGLPSILPPSPFGLSGTKEWLVNVTAACGLEGRVDEVWEEWTQANRDSVEVARRSARRTPVAFVVSPEDCDLLAEPQLVMGVPLLDMLEEWGFPVEVLCYTTNRGSVGSVDAYHPLKQRLPASTLKTFADQEELASLLSTIKAKLVFSDSRCDNRLQRAGKHSFSLRHFELGFQGALRTVQSLVRRGANPYYARFARFALQAQEDL